MSQMGNQGLTTHSFNPVKRKLVSVHECLTQLDEGLPRSKDAYISANRMTHSFVKSCFLMTIQRIIDINSIIIESRSGQSSHSKPRTFFLVRETGAIDDEILNFFQHALHCYEKVVNPHDDLSDDGIYEITRALLNHGRIYINQINNFFDTTGQMTSSYALSASC